MATILSSEEEVIQFLAERILLDGWITKVTYAIVFDGNHTVNMFGASQVQMYEQDKQGTVDSPGLSGLVSVMQATDAAMHVEGIDLPAYWMYNTTNDVSVILIEEKLNIPVKAGMRIGSAHLATSHAAITAGLITIYTIIEQTIACLNSTTPKSLNSKNAPTRMAMFVRTNNVTANIAYRLPVNGRIGNIRVLWNPGALGADNILVVGRGQENQVFPTEASDMTITESGNSFLVTKGYQENEDSGIITNHHAVKIFMKKGEHFWVWSRDDEGTQREYIISFDFIPEFDAHGTLTWQLGDLADDQLDNQFVLPFDIYARRAEIDWTITGTTSVAGMISCVIMKPGTPTYGIDGDSMKISGQLTGPRPIGLGEQDKLPAGVGSWSYDLTSVDDVIVVAESGKDEIDIYDYCPAGTVFQFYHESILGTGSPENTFVLHFQARTKHNNWNNNYHSGTHIWSQELSQG